ncbi:MAG: DASH family cryptochrome [Flavobacteriaceae bacterium]
MQTKLKTALVWLKNDLRLTDQQSFDRACRQYDRVVAYYTFEPDDYLETDWGFSKTGKFRTQFILETLHSLKEELSQHRISLIVETQSATDGIPYWINQLQADALFFQKEWTDEEAIRIESVLSQLDKSVAVYSYYDQFLYHPEDLPFPIEEIPQVFTVFRKKCEKLATVRAPTETPKPLGINSLLEEEFSIPELKDLGFEPFEKHPYSAFPFQGGTKNAMDHLNNYFWESQRLSFYKKTRNGLLGTDYSSKFSPWLANGALSARMIYQEVKRYEREIRKNDSTYWLVFELIWRDYFKYISLRHGNQIFKLEGILNKSYNWKTHRKYFNQWIQGQTSEPFVNANMIELEKTGFMSNRGRQNVGSYFAKTMLMDWRMGAAYFEHQLIDYDVHSNWGNWLYVSGVGNDPRDRKFNVWVQAERYDVKGLYQKRWLQKTLF